MLDEGPNDQRVIPLLIKDPEDEKRVYQDMGRIWYERHGQWRRYLPFYGVLSLHEVEVRTRLASISWLTENDVKNAVPLPRRHDNDFSIITKELDVFKIKERLRNDLEEAEKLVDKIMDPIYPIRCDENAADGSWEHENPDCLAGIKQR